MFESRCGVSCGTCARKDEVKCVGCVSMTIPFWGGKCGVKSCCEERGLDHCGTCVEFPCKMLSEIGKDQGYDPAPRLERLVEWAKH